MMRMRFAATVSVILGLTVATSVWATENFYESLVEDSLNSFDRSTRDSAKPSSRTPSKENPQDLAAAPEPSDREERGTYIDSEPLESAPSFSYTGYQAVEREIGRAH